MNPAIETRGLHVDIDGTTLLEPTDLTVAPGEWLSVIGPNGAGKSTLLRALVGAVEHGGEVEIEGRALRSMRPTERARSLAWVPQTPVIPTGFRVVDYVLLGRTPHRSLLAAESPEDLRIVEEVLTDLDLLGFADRPIDSLSGGERQRAIIARALAQQAPVLLLDEPTTALDLGHQQEVLLLLDRLRRRGHTLVSTMHDLTLAGQFADRLLLLAGGRVRAEGTAEDVLTEQNLADHYHADVTVTNDRGTVVVVPRIRSRPPTRQRAQDHPIDTRPLGSLPRNPLMTTQPLEENPAADKSGVAKSIVVVNTGDGKGKSSSAFGVMIRGLARGWNVAVLQFIKSGEWHVGEEKIGKQLGVDWFNEGEGFTWDSEDIEHDKALAQQGWERAASIIAAGEHQLVILDELTYLINWGWIDAAPVYDAIRNRPEHVNLVITGRDAPQALIDLADTVSEVRKVKHAFDQGILAKKGIDY